MIKDLLKSWTVCRLLADMLPFLYLLCLTCLVELGLFDATQKITLLEVNY